ncbi:hypothetical protein ACSAZL_02205 [Methanosarcina sp. T3]|uniref:hypothetical protein n=1 Tax=Methanosarcina sp. T3 TaxID=3439062 RepID=UPI003F838D3C
MKSEVFPRIKGPAPNPSDLEILGRTLFPDISSLKKVLYFTDGSPFKHHSPFGNATSFKNTSSFFTSVHQAISDKDIIINWSQQKVTGY